MLQPNDIPYKAVSIGLEPVTLEILRRDLSPKEFRLQSADSMNQLTEILKQGIPDVIYMATDLGGAADPFVLSSRLGKAGIAVLMVSEAPTREVLIKAARHGVMDFLVSPLQASVASVKTDRALIKKGKKAPPEGLEKKIDFGAAKTPNEKVKILLKTVQEVLALPFAVVKIIRLCNDPNASAGDLEKPVKSDPAITAMIMRRANSAVFGGGQTTSIQRAVLRIGMRATRNIAASFSVFKLFTKEEKSFGFNRIWFWLHSLTTGICAQALATILKHQQPEDAFLAGLLHDIGKMVLDDFLNEEFDKAIRVANSERIPMRMAENTIFETTHSYVGSKLVTAWGFPSAIAEGIGQHHLYQKITETGNGLSLGAIVCMANQMSKALQAGSGGDHIAERESLSLWNLLPKEISWRTVQDKVLEELTAYTEVLEIPPEQFKMDLPEASRGKAGIFLPKGGNLGTLLQIALGRQGLEPVLFSSFEELKEKDLILVIGDLTSVQNGDEVTQLQKGISSLHEKNIILSRTNGKDTPADLDFFWLESQLKQALGLEARSG